MRSVGRFLQPTRSECKGLSLNDPPPPSGRLLPPRDPGPDPDHGGGDGGGGGGGGGGERTSVLVGIPAIPNYGGAGV